MKKIMDWLNGLSTAQMVFVLAVLVMLAVFAFALSEVIMNTAKQIQNLGTFPR